MSDSSLTIRSFFSLPEDGAEGRSPGWDRFRECVAKEVKGIKWPAAMPDFAQKVWELLGIPVPDILITGWKKAEAVEKLIEESKANPKQELDVELAEHTIKSDFHPYIEVRIENVPTRKIEFTIELAFKLKGFVLRIQNGLIKELRTGDCQVEGAIKYKDLTVAEKKLAPVQLPGSIPIGGESIAPAADAVRSVASATTA